MRREAKILFFALALMPCACALAQSQWPPSDETAARMHQLQAAIRSAESTPAQRESAREELSKLLKSPAGQERGRTPDEKPVRPPRAAIEPLGALVKPAPNPAIIVPGVAHVDITVAPKPLVVPQTGAVAMPSASSAVDPRTGHVLHETPFGYVDPRTGQFTPR